MSIPQKGIAQAFEIQRRLKIWNPKRAAVMGAGSVGLLATLALRLRGLEVTTFARTPQPNVKADLAESLGAKYVSTKEMSVRESAAMSGPFDLVFEATGFSHVVFDSMQVLAKNGVLVLSSVTAGNQHVDVPSDKINFEFVLGNRAMVGTVSANREHFQNGLEDMALAEFKYPGWLQRLLTNRIQGLDNYLELFDTLLNARGAIKVFCEIVASD
jgi:threonine dehydrogenase-like Zn-dependent dehydrogenase